MTKIFTAPFAQSIDALNATLTTAMAAINTTTPTNTALIASAGAEGALLTALTLLPRGNVTASNIVLWSSVDGGTTKRIVGSAFLPTQSVTATAAITPTTFANISEDKPYRMKAGEQLFIGTMTTETSGVDVSATWTDF